MRAFLIVILCAVASKDVVAEGEIDVKRGTFPFMAFLYYPDDSMIDVTGERFIRSAVLINNDWLISSSDASLAFPNKTLLARVGAINIDENITLNEDEEEQEREIILVVRPYNYSETLWWNADVSLLKTLLPFNATIAPTALGTNTANAEQTCFILVYAKRNDKATERVLMQMFVELLPSTQENCGNNFKKDTMLCAVESDVNATNPRFCQGNNGGPLICDNALTGLQTYFHDCKAPYLYQLFDGWGNLISCATKERCDDLVGSCAHICITLSKDPPLSTASYTIDTETPKSRKMNSNVSGNASILMINQSDDLAPTKTTTGAKATVTKETTASEMDEEVLTNNTTTTLTTAKSHNTISYSSPELLTYKKEEAASTKELERNNHIEAQHKLVRSGATTSISFIFHYLATAVSVLVCLKFEFNG